MASKTGKLELTWVGKEERPRLEPRLLLEDPSKSYGDPASPNMLIRGDNLLALKALEQDFAGEIKCACIDPPYNTGSAFEHYDDGLEHSIWLSLMRDRLEILKRLLRRDGVIFVQIDDNEQPYLRLLMDEIFGRKNFCGQFVWEKKKKPSFLNSNMGVVTEYIVAYSPNRAYSPPFIGGLTTEGKKFPLNNAGNSVQTLTFPAGAVVFRCEDGEYQPQDMSGGNIVTRLLDKLEVREGRNVDAFRLEGEWRYSQRKLDEIVAAGESLIISKVPFRPNHIKEGGAAKKIKNLLTVAHYGMSTYEDATAESEVLFGEQDAFDYPKPEKLIQTLLAAVTVENDFVLDSFAGSGTTGAVAHKMKRRWIMVERGAHCDTHILPRLRKVVDGADLGGVTAVNEWKGGGGFKYFQLAESLLVQDESLGVFYVNAKYNAEMLIRAICKVENFRYHPRGLWHGYSSETHFIHVVTQILNQPYLEMLAADLGEHDALLVYCTKRDTGLVLPPNVKIKRIPKDLLAKCEFRPDLK